MTSLLCCVALLAICVGIVQTFRGVHPRGMQPPYRNWFFDSDFAGTLHMSSNINAVRNHRQFIPSRYVKWLPVHGSAVSRNKVVVPFFLSNEHKTLADCLPSNNRLRRSSEVDKCRRLMIWSLQERENIYIAMEELQKHACGIVFVYFNEDNFPKKWSNYIEIKKSSSNCHAKVGKQDGPQDIKLTEECVSNPGRVMHEMLHILGFVHEHNRPTRDKYVKIFYDNISPTYASDFQAERDAFVSDDYYDYYSIMHYAPDAAAIDSNANTIMALQPGIDMDKVGQRANLTQLDKLKVKLEYPCLQEPMRPPMPIKHNPFAPPSHSLINMCDFELRLCGWHKDGWHFSYGPIPGPHETIDDNYYLLFGDMSESLNDLRPKLPFAGAAFIEESQLVLPTIAGVTRSGSVCVSLRYATWGSGDRQLKVIVNGDKRGPVWEKVTEWSKGWRSIILKIELPPGELTLAVVGRRALNANIALDDVVVYRCDQRSGP